MGSPPRCYNQPLRLKENVGEHCRRRSLLHLVRSNQFKRTVHAAARLAQEKKMTVRQQITLNKLLFKVRARIVDLMSEYRAEWCKRYGHP